MPDRAYFVKPLSDAPDLRWQLADASHEIADFLSESAALESARSLAQLDCSAGFSASVYTVSSLGRVALEWRGERTSPEIAAADYDDLVREYWRKRRTPTD